MKTRILSIVLTLCMVFMLVPATAFAETYGDFEYSVSGDETSGYKVTITKYTGTGDSVVIPKEIDGKTVTSIGDIAFRNCTSLASIVIPDSVTSIGDTAFYGCTSLASIVIPDSVTSIGDTAFYGCTSLASIVIPDSVTSIGQGAFMGCTSLTSITIPDSVTSIGFAAFRNCTSLKNINIPNGVTTILFEAFRDCTNLSSITIPDSVTSIGDGVFSGCTSLASVTIPDSVTSIGERAFSGCTSLASITIPDSVTEIRNTAFRFCTNLSSITIPDSVTLIESLAFYGCTSLESIFLPDKDNLPIGNGAIPATTSQVKYSLDNDKVTITGITLGTDKTSVAIPEKICGYPVNSINAAFAGITSIFLPKDFDETNANVPNTVTKIKYSLDTNKGEVTITEITLGSDKTSVAIPATIFGYPVVAVESGYWGLVGAHTCVGETATCTARALCSLCGKEYGDYADHILEWVEAKDSTCTEDGNTEYWTCSVCSKLFGDENGTTETTLEDVTIDAAGHALTKTEAKAPTCTEDGNTEYWTCSVCDKLFGDENGTTETTLEDVTIDAAGHALTKTEAKAPTCTEIGWNAYEACSRCDYTTYQEIPATGHDWVDGVCRDCGEETVVPTTLIYRLYNPNSGEHFFTGSTEERDALKAAGWDYEGIAWNAPTTTGVPVYRLYNPENGDHHYTLSAGERDTLAASGWTYEGVAWNAVPETHAFSIPLYRLYNPDATCGNYHYTGSLEEREMLEAAGWTYKGIAWYGLLK